MFKGVVSSERHVRDFDAKWLGGGKPAGDRL
jgi:hypothetical protein